MNNEDKILLIRLDERLNALQRKLDEVIKYIEKEREETKKEMVTQTEFRPVKAVMYSMIGMVLTAFFSVLITLVFGVSPK